jgi:hypothetical protein
MNALHANTIANLPCASHAPSAFDFAHWGMALFTPDRVSSPTIDFLSLKMVEAAIARRI